MYFCVSHSKQLTLGTLRLNTAILQELIQLFNVWYLGSQAVFFSLTIAVIPGQNIDCVLWAIAMTWSFLNIIGIFFQPNYFPS